MKGKVRKRRFHLTVILSAMILAFATAIAAQGGQANGSALSDIEKHSAEIHKYPDDPDAYLMRARAYKNLGRTDEAIADLTKAISVSKHPYYVAQATTDRGEVYLKRGDHAKAEEDFAAVVGLKGADPYKPKALLGKAHSLNAQGKRAEALTDLDKAIKLYSSLKRTGARKRLGEAYALRASINCTAGKRKAAATDAAKAKTLGTLVKPCRLN